MGAEQMQLSTFSRFIADARHVSVASLAQLPQKQSHLPTGSTFVRACQAESTILPARSLSPIRKLRNDNIVR